ncbi:hypothetical protein ACPFP2_21115 [Micromonospora citrea]|uniref:hypothetical protein n=1 Tax=Micromonospora citrea TaxID=47855 RepID=UPI003C3E9670
MKAVVTADPDGTREVHDVSTPGPGPEQAPIKGPAGAEAGTETMDRVADGDASLPAVTGPGGRG